MKNSDWQQKIYTFSELRQFAYVRQDMSRAVDFLKAMQVIPYTVERVPAPDYIKTNLDPEQIPAGYLAALAYEWDSDGPSTPLEFIDSLRPEMMGTAERDNVREQLEMVGKEQI